MAAAQLQPGKAQEIQEYLAAERELAAARELEAAEFIRAEIEFAS